MKNCSVRLCLASLAIGVATLAGCGGSSGGGKVKEHAHARAITSLYFSATSALGGPPANEAAFKEQIANVKPDLSILDVGSIDELFVSDRDGQPLVINYGPAAKANGGVVVYEQTGKDGIRFVGNTSGQVQEADAALFAKLVPKPATP
ncbi:hypothetical protein [Lacipirellula parvula]|uniref:Lipoprotein n=1 Tax=Lacipirellula parvula TaxID=2650471 RepID=A0A5K7XMB5_9BACT|nr:hypothetical protein [Lacipirellula parvula]BBO35916.1 hypothetical protein PLANPX_5528 [Lacipirellula parvula]